MKAVKEKPKARCLRYGWKALCNRFRRYLNDGSGPKPEDPDKVLPWADKRAELARKFFKAEGIDPKGPEAHDICHHTPILRTSGRRKCFACETQENIERAWLGKKRS